MTEQETQIAELKRHLEEWDHKFGDLSAKLSRERDESGTIAESGPSHDVEGIVARLPTEHVHERDTRTSRRKVIQERPAVAGISDLQKNDNVRFVKRQASGAGYKVEVKKRKVALMNKIAK